MVALSIFSVTGLPIDLQMPSNPRERLVARSPLRRFSANPYATTQHRRRRAVPWHVCRPQPLRLRRAARDRASAKRRVVGEQLRIGQRRSEKHLVQRFEPPGHAELPMSRSTIGTSARGRCTGSIPRSRLGHGRVRLVARHPPVFVSFPAPSDRVFVRRGCEIDCVSEQTAIAIDWRQSSPNGCGTARDRSRRLFRLKCGVALGDRDVALKVANRIRFS
jgi:hypothetical protein